MKQEGITESVDKIMSSYSHHGNSTSNKHPAFLDKVSGSGGNDGNNSHDKHMCDDGPLLPRNTRATMQETLPSSRQAEKRQYPASKNNIFPSIIEPYPNPRPREAPSLSAERIRRSGLNGFEREEREYKAWKSPFLGVDPRSGKIWFIDTAHQAKNLHTTILRERRLWHQCPFNIFHKIKTDKKFVRHLKSCHSTSSLGFNGKRSKKEAEKWLTCQYNVNHKIHQDYEVIHYIQNCSDFKIESRRVEH